MYHNTVMESFKYFLCNYDTNIPPRINQYKSCLDFQAEINKNTAVSQCNNHWTSQNMHYHHHTTFSNYYLNLSVLYSAILPTSSHLKIIKFKLSSQTTHRFDRLYNANDNIITNSYAWYKVTGSFSLIDP